MQEETEKRTLACELTDKELLTRSRELARHNAKRTELENKKKEVVADCNARIQAQVSNIECLSAIVSNGYEYREVECTWEFDWEKDKKILIRKDTFTTVDMADITEEERQMSLLTTGNEKN